MQRYEIVKELFLPCTGSHLPQESHIEEQQLESPAQYVYNLHPDLQGATVSQVIKNDCSVFEVQLATGQRHRYTFTKL